MKGITSYQQLKKMKERKRLRDQEREKISKKVNCDRCQELYHYGELKRTRDGCYCKYCTYK